MFCSTIIPTVGRSALIRAVESVLNQTFAAENFEAVVVNDSGECLAEADWQQSQRVTIIDTCRRERSVARNAGAAVAKGRYLHFLDDDDWLAPDALQHLWNLANQRAAAWLYGGSQLVDRQGRLLVQLHHRLDGNCFSPVMAGEWIPLQSSLIASKVFFAVGGFNPLLQGPEDIDLLRRVALRYDIAGTEAVVAYIERGEAGSTTDYDRYPAQSRQARERILDEPGVFSCLRQSANNSFWHGRIVRAYLTSMVWNLLRRQLLVAASRATYGLVGLAVAGRGVFSSGFWRAVARPYQSETFRQGFAQLEQEEAPQLNS